MRRPARSLPLLPPEHRTSRWPVPKERPLARQIGERIKSLRLHARGGMLTQEHVAEQAGISMSFLSMIERGMRMPHIETLASLAAVLEVPLDELFREKENRVPEPPDAAVRPLAEFLQRHLLSRHDVNRLLAVAEAIFEG